jgi:PAS domain S-box-containing protein
MDTLSTQPHVPDSLEHALGDSEERFRAVVETASDAIILADCRGTIMSWNRAAQRLFGYAAEEVTGHSLTCLMPARYREAHEKGLERVRMAGRSRLAGKPVELHGLRKDGTEFPLELSLGTWQSGGGIFFSGIIRDITERKRVEDFHRTQVAVSMVLASCDSLAQAAPQLIQAVCDITGWELGLIWLVDRDAAVLRCEALWHQPTVPGSGLTAMKEYPSFPSGVGLPGRIWASGEPTWVPDVLKDVNFPRAQVAADAGLHGAFGVPIRSGRRMMGVIEFFSREIRQPDTTLLQMMADIGIKVGQFIERKKDTERLKKINECLLSFGKDAHENINRLTALCGELLGGAWAVYNYAEGDQLHAIGRWRTPADFQPVHKAEGHLCAEVIRQGRNDLMVVRHLPATSYAQTDPYVLAGRLQTYLGQAVRRNGRYIGA